MNLWRDGRWLTENDAVTALNDRGLMLGEGLFETMRLKRGQIVRAQAHENRLRNSCAELGLTPPGAGFDLTEIIRQFVRDTDSQDACVRLSLSSGVGQRGLDRAEGLPSSIWVQFSELPTKLAPLNLATSKIQKEPTSVAAKHKTLSYIDNTIARSQAKGAGADMALMLDSDGHLSGSDCGNLFWIRANRIFTPSLDCAVLPGTARAAVLSDQRVEEGRFKPGVLADAQSVFITNALIGAVQVRKVDGRDMGMSSSDIMTISKLLD